MGFLTKKREIDFVSIISISSAAVILTFFASWLYFSSVIDKMQSSYELKVSLIKDNSAQLREKNKKLEEELKNSELYITSCEEYIKTLEE